MLRLRISDELFDNEKQEFFQSEGFILELEHSLVSLSKWESIWEKPFLSATEKTTEEALSYIECMIIDPDFPPEVFSKITEEQIGQIRDYIEAKSSATWFSEYKTASKSRELITAELIYYWMSVFNIDIKCEHWHLSKLFNLIKIADLKNQKQKPIGKDEQAQRNREENERRRKEWGTSG